jgi:RNA polymerase sigma factor (sigma-70 family)
MVTKLSKAIHRACDLTHWQGLTDGDLLSRFVHHKDAGAFEALLVRHGPLVLSVCRRILKNAADAEDAFQATFLVLLRSGRSIRNPASLASWLHGVARRTALHAKRAAARRRSKEAAVMPKAEVADRGEALGEVLDEELACLPEPYRAAILLCDLGGKTRKEAARELGCAEGTVASRLSRGRSLLAGRLSRRGVRLAGVVLCSAVPASLVASTVKLATGPASAPVAALTRGVLGIMLLNKLKRVAGALVLFVVLTAGAGLTLSAWSGQADGQGGRGKPAGPQAKEVPLGDLSAGYAENDASGDEQFAGKRVQVSGHVWEVRRVERPAPFYVVTLANRTARGFDRYDPPVAFRFTRENRKQLAGLRRGQQVTVEGQCEGRVAAQRDHEVILVRDCRLVSAEPAPPPGKRPRADDTPAPGKAGR